MYLKTQRVTN